MGVKVADKFVAMGDFELLDAQDVLVDIEGTPKRLQEAIDNGELGGGGSGSGGVQEVEITGVENNLRLISSVSAYKNNETELTYYAKNDCVICVSIITGNGNHDGNCYDREISVITEGQKVSEYDEHEDKTYSGTAHLEFYVLKSGQSITSKGKMTNGNDSCELVNSLYLFTSILDISNTEYMFWGHNENKSALTREFTPTKSGYALVFRMAMGGSYNSEGLQFSGTGGEVITSTYIQPTIISGYATYITYELYKVNAGDTLKVSQYSNNASGARHVLIGAFIEDEDITRFSLEGLGLKINGYSAYEIAVDKGFVGTETEWLESLKGSDGTTPHIDESTKNWFIGDTDTGILAQGTNGVDGKDGKSISTITKDDDDNLIVTFTDGSTQNIGKLSVDIQGDFLTSDGFGNLRYYNGKFQYYDNTTSAWVDTSVTPSNVYIMNMTPQEMKSIFGVYDTVLGKYKLKFEEPDDTVIDGQVACIVEKVIIRRKLGSVPISETDGDLVLEIKRKDFGTYKNEYFIDTALSPSNGDVYYYKAFPMSTTGFYNYSDLNETDGIKCKNYNLYGFKLDQNESDPSGMITYIEDNKCFESAYMNYATDTFKYGDWSDAWFIKNLKPCMLKYDGTVDYELDKDDYSKKLDGTDSDVANASYGGNAMVGIPKIYCKIVDNGDNTANIYFSDKQVDTDFHCWSHIDNNGNEIDYCYMPIFNGSLVDGKLRSLSGRTPIASKTASDEINYAKANNVGSDVIWYTELFNDRMLVELLLFLIGKSTDTQAVFGAGNNSSYISASNMGIKNTGTMNTKGLFWGNQDNKSGVKVFGMEHWWGNQWRRIGGWINDKGTQKIKMTYGQSDGSIVDGYNLDGNGYITIANSTPSGTDGGYISKMLITDNGLIPTILNGSATTYYCDAMWFNNSQVDYASVGGDSNAPSLVGALYSILNFASSGTRWNIGAALSCKPLAK